MVPWYGDFVILQDFIIDFVDFVNIYYSVSFGIFEYGNIKWRNLDFLTQDEWITSEMTYSKIFEHIIEIH